MSTAQTGSSRIVCPYVASMAASGEATYVYVQQETVQIAGIDYEFDVSLNATNTKKILEAFTVSGKGVDASLNVVLSASGDFHEVLMGAINGSWVAKRSANSKTPSQQFAADLHTGLLAAINIDALANTVQNVDFTGVAAYLDSSGGARDMANNMNDERCRLLYTQISPASLYLYTDGSGAEDISCNALPLKGGDVLSFVFDVDLSNVTPAKSQTDINTSADPTGVTSGQVAGNYTSGLHFNLASKRIAINLAMDGTVGEKISGLRTA